MGKSSIIWGGLLVLFGAVLLLSNLGLVDAERVWGFFWPLLMIFGGLWILSGFFRQATGQLERVVLPLEAADQARIAFHHAAGRLHVDGSADADNVLQGDFGNGVRLTKSRTGGLLEVGLHSPSGSWAGDWGRNSPQRFWRVSLNPAIPLKLDFETGAGEAWIDLSALRVVDLRLQTGASSTNLTLPAQAGFTGVRIGAGAASIKVRIPDGVAANIRSQSGMASIKVNLARFPRQGADWQSPDYLTAANKVDISLEAGVANIEIL